MQQSSRVGQWTDFVCVASSLGRDIYLEADPCDVADMSYGLDLSRAFLSIFTGSNFIGVTWAQGVSCENADAVLQTAVQVGINCFKQLYKLEYFHMCTLPWLTWAHGVPRRSADAAFEL